MSETPKPDTSLEVKGPGGFAAKATGPEVLLVAASVVGGLMLYMVYEHRNEARADNAAVVAAQKESSAQLATVLREMNTTNRELVVVQRVTNCLISKSQEDRRIALQECERNSR